MHGPVFTAITDVHDSGPRVRLGGELDVATVARFHDEMDRARAHAGAVTVDVSALTAIGVSGVEAIASEAIGLGGDGRDLLLVSSRPEVLDAVLRRGLGDLLPVERTPVRRRA